jgi:hypothetical protein
MLCVAQVYMLVELMLEVYVAHIDGVTARHMLRTDHWFQLACFVLLCNWICIIQPQQYFESCATAYDARAYPAQPDGDLLFCAGSSHPDAANA